MKSIILSLTVLFIAGGFSAKAQLIITPQSVAQVLAARLVGDGVTVSNATVTGNPLGMGFFKNVSGTNIGLDSGVVLSNGRVKTVGSSSMTKGMDGNGVLQAYIDPLSSSSGAFASFDQGTPGDADLDPLVADPTFDATVLEFDFVPLGDSVKFRYVFSSEEYPEFPCTGVNDAFAFFIRGPGFAAPTNIALIPGTTSPVTIDNINDIGGCGPFPQYYLTNKTNVNFTYNGHTVILTAAARVQPCQVYHLKLVIADVGDHIFDSGVFIEAKSLSSSHYTFTNISQIDAQGNYYLVEGCLAGAVKINKAVADPLPETISLEYGGTAINGVDVQLLPASVTIPAGQLSAQVDLTTIVDNLPEGIETLKIYTLAGCTGAIRTDSTILQIRDYDILQLSPGMDPDTAYICRNSSQVLTATTGYSVYRWNPNPELDDINSRTPVCTPVGPYSKYICTATIGTCNAKDSVNIKWKDFSLLSKQNINCKGASTGQIKVLAGLSNEWTAPLEFWYGNNAHQPDSVFNNLPVGTYTIKIKDATGCIDSLPAISLVQAYPDLDLSVNAPVPSCLVPSVVATVTGSGGLAAYTYSLNGGLFQSSPVFNVTAGAPVFTIKDQNGCTKDLTKNLVPPANISLSVSGPVTICEGNSTTLHASSTDNPVTFAWTPAATLQQPNTNSPVASPVITTKYYVTAAQGICTRRDSVLVTVNPAPVADAGPDQIICTGADTQLNGSGGLTFLWAPPTHLSDPIAAQPDVLQLQNTQAYFLHVKDINGCRSLIADTVKIFVTPPVRIFAGNDSSVAIGQPIQLNAVELSNDGIVTWSWSPSYGLSSVSVHDPVLITDHDMTYTVTATTAGHCIGEDIIKIKAYLGPQIYMPSAFSPNGDGRNDLIRPLAFGMKSVDYFRIYNRYGEIVFSANDFNKGWDGKIRGVSQTTGTYVWVAEATDYKGNPVYRKGSFILLK